MGIKDKIKKLRALANDPAATPAEAKLAREKADALAKADPTLTSEAAVAPRWQQSPLRTSLVDDPAKAKANRNRVDARAQRKRAKRKQPRLEPGTDHCGYCGRKFRPNAEHRVYCSMRCAKKDRGRALRRIASARAALERSKRQRAQRWTQR
jgi:endogenous inhibitor of DNA gyrase (YacG/DUF329 family)